MLVSQIFKLKLWLHLLFARAFIKHPNTLQPLLTDYYFSLRVHVTQ
ncbi:hypothetical protein OAF20_01270 [bacterium]|nr:hypothetical protein [bacterium]